MDKSSADLIQHTEDNREQYEKPSIEIIHLTKDMVGGICKTVVSCTDNTEDQGS